MRIVIADDSPGIQDRLKEMISHIGNTSIVGLASDGVEAIHSIHSLKPDVVILDLHMPKASGFDVIKDIIKNDMATVVLVVTNYSLAPYREKCSQLGVKYFFDKTNEFEQAMELIEDLATEKHNEWLMNEK